ncbi:pyrimidine dimer DNA glycosylase/endonuclease V [Candidatus Woesearchaeota archaeon]|nr:pyrimidine dimer DNA glycosylase/endonuclease V [Candidatus Woesearchaeota archaeon]
MRLWSLHPKYLDSKGLVALWRETLLAKKVLEGKTNKYKNHPQLNRFKQKPIKFINTYLYFIWKESCERGYCFDKRKIKKPFTKKKLKITRGQILYEFKHLKNKLKKRNPKKYKEIFKIKKPKTNALFALKKGAIESWEKLKNSP